MSFPFHGKSPDEREVASIVAGLHANKPSVRVASVASTGTKKRPRDCGVAAALAHEKRPRKKTSAAASSGATTTGDCTTTRANTAAAAKKKRDPPPPMLDATGLVFAQPELKPPPYFYYTDHSLERDDDPLTPMTAAGSVPTFPAKMHAILTNPQLADVVGWAPHGRAWCILKPRDFEIRVLPKYFEHSKFSSFVRQANGWGFRRMSSNTAYYHEYFLRAMPWLCKKMRRPKVAEKKAVDPDMEPDLVAISAQSPVPDAPPTREVLVLQKTIELGPKERMPVMWDTGIPAVAASPSSFAAAASEAPSVVRDILLEDAISSNRVSRYADLKPAAMAVNPPSAAVSAPRGDGAAPTITVMNAAGNHVHTMFPQGSVATPSNQNNLTGALHYATLATKPPNNIAQAIQSNLASDSHFAAGFMAATAYHSNHIRNVFGSFATGMPIFDNGNLIVPSAPTAVATGADFGSSLALLRGAGMGRSNLHPLINPGAPASNSDLNVGSGGTASEQHAMLRLRQFQAFSSKFE